MRSETQEFETQQVAIAFEEYLEEKARARAEGRPHSVTYKTIAARHGWPPNKIHDYRVNNYAPARIARRKTTDAN